MASAQTTHLSIFQLVSNPTQVDSKLVSVAGVLGTDHDNNYVLYTDAGSQANEVVINSVLLWLGPGEFEHLGKLVGKYVLVIGRFESQAPRGLHSGVLLDVSMIRDYPLMKALGD
jgi:hypothetical protein